MKNYTISKLFFGTGYLNFAKAISQRQLHMENLLDEKLEQYLFFYRANLEVFPSYNFGIQVQAVLDSFIVSAEPSLLDLYEAEFLCETEKCLQKILANCLQFGRFYPQMFRDFGVYYPRYGVPFDNVECIYLDFGSQTPKVIDSLLKELLLREIISAEPWVVHLEVIDSVLVMNSKFIFPPVAEISDEALTKHIVKFLSGEDEESVQISLQVISFYLKARPQILEECSSALMAKKLIVNEVSLMNYFLGEYIFKGVSNEAKRFFVANSDLMEKNPFKKIREISVEAGDSFSAEDKQGILTWAKCSLEVAEERLFKKQLTLVEKQARLEASRKKLQEGILQVYPKAL